MCHIHFYNLGTLLFIDFYSGRNHKDHISLVFLTACFLATCAWFLEIVFVCTSVCLRVCPPPRALIKSHVKYIHNNWIKQFTAFPFLYITLAVNKLNGRGHSNNVHREHLPKKTKKMQY